jgi:predicted Fe-Mo cluster-binding NifX family protein
MDRKMIFLKIGLILSALLIIVSVPAFASEPLKVAVASAGKDGSSNVGPTATRSPYFLIFNSKGKLLEAIENPYIRTRPGSGACVEAMNMLKKKGVTHIIAGAFGPRTSSVIRNIGIKQVSASGIVRDSLSLLLKKNRL